MPLDQLKASRGTPRLTYMSMLKTYRADRIQLSEPFTKNAFVHCFIHCFILCTLVIGSISKSNNTASGFATETNAKYEQDAQSINT